MQRYHKDHIVQPQNVPSIQKKGTGKIYQEEKKIKNVPKCCVKAVSQRASEKCQNQKLWGWYQELNSVTL